MSFEDKILFGDDSAAIYNYLLIHPEKIDIIQSRTTPLITACANRRNDVVDILINLGANVNYQDSYRQTPLHFAVRIGDINIISALLSA